MERAELRFLASRPVRVSLAAAAVYCVAMALAWATFSTQMPVDWGSELVLAQELRAFYIVSNPPLYTWIAWALLQLLPPGQTVFLIVNYVATFALFWLYAYAAHLTLKTRLLVAIAPWSLFLILPYSRLNYGFVNTQLLLPSVLATVALVLLIARQPRLGNFAALGIVAGLGVLSKLNYLFTILMVLGAACLQAPMRTNLLRPAFLIGLGLALAVIAPYAIGFHEAGNDIFSLLRSKTSGAGAAGYLDKVWAGLASAVGVLAEYLGPSLGIGLAGLVLARTVGDGQNEADPARATRRRFIRDLLIVGLAVILAGIVIFGVSHLKSWYMHAFFLLAPLYSLSFWDGARHERLVLYGAALTVIGFAIVQSAVRIVEFTPSCIDTCRDVVPYDGLARELRAAGFERGTIVGMGVLVAGNLRPYFARSRVGLFGPSFLPKTRAGGPTGQCLAVWRAEDAPNPAKAEAAARATFAKMGLGAAAAGAAVGVVRLRWRGWSGGPRGRHAGVSVWRYMLIATPNRHCG